MSWENDLTPEERVSWDKWVEHVRSETVHKMNESAFVMQLVQESDKMDIKFAVEVGLSIMLDKPILAVAAPGVTIPRKLRKVADVVIYADIDTEAGRHTLSREIENFIERLSKETK